MNTKNITKEELAEIISTVTTTVINQLSLKEENDAVVKEKPAKNNTEYLVEMSLGRLNDDGSFDRKTRICKLRGSNLEEVMVQAVHLLEHIPKGEVTAQVDVYTYEFGGSEEHHFEGTKYARFAVAKHKAELIEMASKNDYRALLEHIKEDEAQRTRDTAAKTKYATDILYAVEVSSGTLYDDGIFDVAETICYRGYKPTEIIREAVRRLADKTKARKEITVLVNETVVEDYSKNNPLKSVRYERYAIEPTGEVKYIEGVMKDNYRTLLAHIKEAEAQSVSAKSDAMYANEENIWREIPLEARRIVGEAAKNVPCVQFKLVSFAQATSGDNNIGLWIYPKRAEVMLEGLNTDMLPTTEGLCIPPVVIKEWSNMSLIKNLGYTQRGYIIKTIIDAINDFLKHFKGSTHKTHELESLLKYLSIEFSTESAFSNKTEPKKTPTATAEDDRFVPKMGDKSYAILVECGVFAEDDYFIPKVSAYLSGNNLKKLKSNAVINLVSQLECNDWRGTYRNEIIVRVRRYTRGDDGIAIGYEPVYERYAIEAGGTTLYLGELSKAKASVVINITNKKRGINMTKVFYGSAYEKLRDKEEEFIAELANGIDGVVDVTVSYYVKGEKRYYMRKINGYTQRSVFGKSV